MGNTIIKIVSGLIAFAALGNAFEFFDKGKSKSPCGNPPPTDYYDEAMSSYVWEYRINKCRELEYSPCGGDEKIALYRTDACAAVAKFLEAMKACDVKGVTAKAAQACAAKGNTACPRVFYRAGGTMECFERNEFWIRDCCEEVASDAKKSSGAVKGTGAP